MSYKSHGKNKKNYRKMHSHISINYEDKFYNSQKYEMCETNNDECVCVFIKIFIFCEIF